MKSQAQAHMATCTQYVQLAYQPTMTAPIGCNPSKVAPRPTQPGAIAGNKLTLNCLASHAASTHYQQRKRMKCPHYHIMHQTTAQGTTENTSKWCAAGSTISSSTDQASYLGDQHNQSSASVHTKDHQCKQHRSTSRTGMVINQTSEHVPGLGHCLLLWPLH